LLGITFGFNYLPKKIILMISSKAKSNSNSTNQNEQSNGLLGSTVGSFASRITKGLKEQEQKQGQAAKLREMRHGNMLQAMTTIRKALQETCKIKLGERFGFDLDVSDWEGWPRVELRLVDSLAPERDCLGLIVTANDHNELGTILISMKSGEVFGKIQLANPVDFERIPVVLKRSVRSYLDIVGSYVLNPVPEDVVEAAAKPIETNDFDDASDKLSKEDVFISDEYDRSRDNLVDEAGPEGFSPLALATK